MTGDVAEFRRPSRVERLFNRLFGAMVGVGLGARHNYLVEVSGRKTGRVYATPVNVLDLGGRRFLVAPRGRTEWVRNVEAGGRLVLRKGSRRDVFRVRAVRNEDKPDILHAYLDRFRLTVQRYFPVAAGGEPRRFLAVADRYPVFELLRDSD